MGDDKTKTRLQEIVEEENTFFRIGYRRAISDVSKFLSAILKNDKIFEKFTKSVKGGKHNEPRS